MSRDIGSDIYRAPLLMLFSMLMAMRDISPPPCLIRRIHADDSAMVLATPRYAPPLAMPAFAAPCAPRIPEMLFDDAIL